LVIQENADANVRHDLEDWYARTAPDSDPRYRHDEEGPDDMAAHIRTSLCATSLTVPVTDGALALGTWQAIFLFEHRIRPMPRTLVVTVDGVR
jgi:secondary thiamine-phosphate synthase enzyme